MSRLKIILTVAVMTLVILTLGFIVLNALSVKEIGELTRMGAVIQKRDYFYEEWNPLKVGTPYRVTFNDVDCGRQFFEDLEISMPERWKPISIELRSCSLELDFLINYQSTKIAEIHIVNPKLLNLHISAGDSFKMEELKNKLRARGKSVGFPSITIWDTDICPPQCRTPVVAD